MAELGATTTATAAQDVLPVYLAKELLRLSELNTEFVDLADEETMPEGQGKVFQSNRYERVPLPSAPLSEGTTPTATPLTVSSVQGVLDQWGIVISMTDVGLMTVNHPQFTIARERVADAMGRLWDRECQNVLMGGANVVFAGGKTTRATLVAGDIVTSDLIAQTTATLRQLGAPEYSAGAYAGICDPYVEQDIRKNPDFVQAHVYANQQALLRAEAGLWNGVRWKRTNHLPIIAILDAAASAITVTNAAVAGAETGFDAASTVRVVVTKLDDLSGMETLVSAVRSATAAAAFTVDVTLTSGLASGTYRVYVGLQDQTITTHQRDIVHTTGTADVLSFIKAGTPSNGTTYVVQATGRVAPPAPPATGNVHISYVFGKSAFGIPKIGKKFTATMTPPVASDSDPLIQRRKVGAKTFFKPIIKNSDFYRRIETLSNFN